MAANLQFLCRSGSFGPLFPFSSPTLISRFRPVSVSFNSIFAPIFRSDAFTLRFGTKIRREQCRVAAVMLLPDNPVVSDICATAVSGGVALSLLRLWTETAKRGLDQVLFLLSTDFPFPFLFLFTCFLDFCKYNRKEVKTLKKQKRIST